MQGSMGLRQVKLTIATALAAALLAGSLPLAAQDSRAQDDSPGVADVAKTPLTDLNLSKDEIPQVLLDAMTSPYADPDGKGCAGIRDAIVELDVLLGPDYDKSGEDEDGRDVNEGRIAQNIVGSAIPFRGLIREATGAAAHQRKFTEAIMAGMARRGYLKGLGKARGCAHPARPAA